MESQIPAEAMQHNPEEAVYYLGVGQVNKLASERLSYAKVKEAIVQANDSGALKKLEALDDYPGEQFDTQWLKKSLQLRRLQGKLSTPEVVKSQHILQKGNLIHSNFKSQCASFAWWN